MSLRGMYMYTVGVYATQITMEKGSMKTSWGKISEIIDPLHNVPGEMKCRIDFGFLRPGKDAPSPIVAGRAPDRVGVMAFDYTPHVRAGHRIRITEGPMTGTYELKNNPDPAVGYDSVHHLEVQIVEVAQSAIGFPAGG